MGKYRFEHYIQIIDIMYEEHIKHTGDWLSSLNKDKCYNLKKVLVSDICSSDPNDMDGFVDENFLKYLDNYKTSLFSLYAKILHRVENESNLDITGRIKGDDSILLKLQRKRFEGDGKFPINKYLNDLLGFRIIDDNYDINIKLIPSYIDKLKKQKKRFVHKKRKNGNYEGYHIYFMGANKTYFPMELQIWDSKHERINFESHEIYKKEYTYWPKIYKHG